MKRKWLWIGFILLFGLILISAGGGARLRVMVRAAQIRSKPSYLGSIVARLQYEDIVVQASDPQKGWIKVTLESGKSPGWINMSSLIEYKEDMKASGANVGETASSGNIQAAGKGFTKEIEAEYKSEQHLDYAWVDRMEKYSVTAQQAAAFMDAGGLIDTLGGAE
ncbi:MAG: hypothetical protein JXD23_07190 [Spirochaetales bacterium]|nr:hypothetical protein [Spirochaetales bacterium]